MSPTKTRPREAQCTVGVPREIKEQENRVALVPSGAYALVKDGHSVLVQAGAGEGSGLSDDEYRSAGATIIPDADTLFDRAEIIVKVKEPLAEEYRRIKPRHLVFTYFHFAASRELTEAMMRTGAACIAYETIVDREGRLPLLTPMSEVAGRMSVLAGAGALERQRGGRGVLVTGVPGVMPARVVVLGGGVVGYNAARVAAGLGALVQIFDINLDRLRYLDEVMPANVTTLHSNPFSIRKAVAHADLVIGAVLVPGARAPVLIPRSYLKEMQPGSVIVDVAVDQGGCVETCHPTTHAHPTYEVDGVIHYCVANMPGAVARTSTFALTNATLPFLQRIAAIGVRGVARAEPGLAKGLNIWRGKIYHEGVSSAFELPLSPLEEVMAQED
ncbi:MAG: alanine dehydrogenase [Planctomycetes bacterium]|nr:alanine dehydrogenase [Planctomycetota bacterium]